MIKANLAIFAPAIMVAVVFSSRPSSGATPKPGDDLRITLLQPHQESGRTARDPITYEISNIGSNRPVLVFLPEDSRYSYKIELFDAKGQAVPRTKTGEAVGAAFDKLPPTAKFDRSVGSRAVFTSSTNEIRAIRIRVEGGASAPILPSPDELFAIPRAGTYKLLLRAQCYVPSTNSTVDLIRFPPVEADIRRP